MRTYESYKLSRAFLCFTLGSLLLVTLIILYILGGGLGTIKGGAPLPPHLFVFWCGVLGVIWFYYLRFPWEIRFLNGDTLEFRRVLGSKVVPIREITSIRGMFLRPGYLKIKYNGGTVWLICQMTGLYELIYLVKSVNPAVAIKNC